MQRSKQHEILKRQERGIKEKPVRGGRLNAWTKIKAVEIERTGSTEGLKHAIEKLKGSHKPQKILRVQQKDMEKARQIAKQGRAKITITNLSKTKRTSIK